MTGITPISSTQVAYNPYAIDTTPVLTPPAIIDTEEKIPSKEKSRGILATFFKWIINEFKRDSLDSSEKKEEESPQDFIEHDRVQKQLQSISQMENHFKDMTEEEFAAALSEYNLDLNWLKAFTSQIKINRNQTHLDNMQMLKLHEFIELIKKKIDESMEKRLNASKKFAFFGKIEAETSSLLLASSIAFMVLGIASGGTIPVILIGAQAVAQALHGATQIAKGVYQYKNNLTEADLLGVSKERKHAHDQLKDLGQRHQHASEAVNDGYKRAHDLLVTMMNTTQGFTR